MCMYNKQPSEKSARDNVCTKGIPQREMYVRCADMINYAEGGCAGRERRGDWLMDGLERRGMIDRQVERADEQVRGEG